MSRREPLKTETAALTGKAAVWSARPECGPDHPARSDERGGEEHAADAGSKNDRNDHRSDVTHSDLLDVGPVMGSVLGHFQANSPVRRRRQGGGLQERFERGRK